MIRKKSPPYPPTIAKNESQIRSKKLKFMITLILVYWKISLIKFDDCPKLNITKRISNMTQSKSFTNTFKTSLKSNRYKYQKIAKIASSKDKDKRKSSSNWSEDRSNNSGNFESLEVLGLILHSQLLQSDPLFDDWVKWSAEIAKVGTRTF